MFEFGSPIEKGFTAALYAELAVRPVPLLIHPQAPVGPYSADLLLAAAERRVAVECDGHEFHERTPKQAEHDKKRDRFFARERITVLRFTGREINRDAARCARESLSVLWGRWPPIETKLISTEESGQPASFSDAVRITGRLGIAERLSFVEERPAGDGFVETVSRGFAVQLPRGADASAEEKRAAIERVLDGIGIWLPVGLVRSVFFQSMAQHFGLPHAELVAEARKRAAALRSGGR